MTKKRMVLLIACLLVVFLSIPCFAQEELRDGVAECPCICETDCNTSELRDCISDQCICSCTSSPAIDIEKMTNGEDADTAPGLTIIEGDPVTWTYVVTNTGNAPLDSISVVDNQGVSVTCPGTTLEPGESMTCTASGTAATGQYSNIGTASGEDPFGTVVQDTDPSHYFGQARVKYVFLTSTMHAGNFGGASGADAICQSLATTAGLSGTFKAWVSTTTSSPSTSFTHSSIPYVLTNGTKIADNWDDLIDGTLDAPILVFEDGTAATWGNVWTGTNSVGGVLLSAAWWGGPNCENWTSASSGYGYYGNASLTNEYWSGKYEWQGSACSSAHPLYCFQQ